MYYDVAAGVVLNAVILTDISTQLSLLTVKQGGES